MTPIQAHLNKVFRAVHDQVCLNCGGEMRPNPSINNHQCLRCGFSVSFREMKKMEDSVKAYGEEAVKVFLEWRKNTPP